MVHGLEGEYWRQVDFVYLDIENPNNYQALRSRFGNVNTIPSFYLLSPDGEILTHWVGVETRDNMRQKLSYMAQMYPSHITQNQAFGDVTLRMNQSIWWAYVILSYMH